ncbi:hypothetical protein HMPREF0290_2067 [Corynebacterium efficiens YS-314]|nr:hypothetical protein [Corynebacterium efficiens]EEW49380.1 hypothetical protein HMPREF0290_2067 [Corynebacterium efficiens YS-314]
MNNLPSSLSRKSPTTRRGLRALTVVIACSTAVFLASCAEEPPEEPTTEVEQAVGLAVDAPRITLEDAGTGELREIRYTDVPDPDASDSPTRQTTTLTVEDGFAQSVVPAADVDPTAPEGGDVSTMRLPVTAEVTPAEPVDTDVVDPSREISIQVGLPAFTDVELAEDILSTEGFTLGIRADDQGRQSTLSLAAPVDATDTGRVMMEQYLLKYTSLPVIFPEEAIGSGARWSVDTRVTGESTLLQTVTYTITAIRGNQIDLDVSVSQRPSLGALEISPGTAGVTEDTPEQLTVLNSNTASAGSITVDLTQPLPTAGTVSWTTRVVYGGGTEDMRVVQDSTASVTFGS